MELILPLFPALAGGFFPLLLLFLVIYWRAARETISAAEFRAYSGYQTAQLSAGVTCYMDFGSEDSEPIIIVHGGTLGSMAYQGYVPKLVDNGWRVIIYDQYGRGFSDRLNFRLGINALQEQLLELLDFLKIERAHLFGISLGGGIIARFAAEHGERVRSLAYQVPVIEGVTLTPAIIAARMPLIGAMLTRLIGVPAIVSRGESFGTQSQEARRVLAHFTDQFNVKGTERAIRDLMIGDALSDRMEDHRKIGQTGQKAQFVYAVDDPEIAAEQVEAALAHYRSPDVHTYTGGHFFASAYMEELPVKLSKFFRSVEV